MEQPIPKDLIFNVRELITDAVTRIDDLANVETRRVNEKIESVVLAANQRFEAQQLALKDALISQEKAVAAALEGTKEAITKNDANTDKRFDLLSEKIDGVMGALNKNVGERGIYVTHSDLSVEMEKLRTSFETMLRPLVTFMNSQQGKSSGLNSGWIYLIGAISLIGTIISIFFALSRNAV